MQIIDLQDTEKSKYFAITKSSIIIIIVLSFDHHSFDQLNMSNHSLPARGTEPPFSHKSLVLVKKG